jgi:hypothetical protein
VLPIRQGTLLIREAVTLGQLNPDRIFGKVTIFQPHLGTTGCHSAAFLCESYGGWSENKCMHFGFHLNLLEESQGFSCIAIPPLFQIVRSTFWVFITQWN